MHPLIAVEIVLLLAGLTGVAIAIPMDSRPVAGFGLLLMGVGGGCQLYLALFQRDRYWSLCDIQGGSLLLSYFGGGATTLMLSQSGLIGGVRITNLVTLLEASIFILLMGVLLFGFGRIEARLWRRLWPNDDTERWPNFVALGLLGLGALQAAMIATGRISMQGVTDIVDQELPIFVSLVVALSWPLAGMCGWILGKEALRRRPLFFYTAVSLIPIQILFNFAHGRRVILFQIIIFFTCLVWSRRKGFTLNQGLVMGSIAIPLAYFLWLFFIALRMEGYTQGGPPGSDKRNLFTRMDSAVEMMDDRWGTVADSQEKEVIDRVYVIGYMIDLMDRDRVTNRFNGKAMAYMVVNSIPRMILPTKRKVLASLKASEEDISIRFNLGEDDRADSLITAAYIDFRWLGPLVYASFAFLFSCILVGLCLLLRFQFFSLYVLCYVFFFALGTEQSFVTGCLNMLRIIVIVAVLLMAYRFLDDLAGSDRRQHVRI